jgi:hypothetical protein
MLPPECTTPQRSVCFNCRRLAFWREQRGLPDICPHSFTVANLPPPPLPPANLPQPTEHDRTPTLTSVSPATDANSVTRYKIATTESGGKPCGGCRKKFVPPTSPPTSP